MSYLKCNHCGHYNEAKTEYQVFCESCGKKLENNFYEWKKTNPDKTFIQFKEIVCVSEPQQKAIVKKQRGRIPSRGWKFFVGFGVTFIVVYFITYYSGGFLANQVKKPAYNKAMIEMAIEINKNCPLMTDKATRLDNVTAFPDNIFQYNYTLINMSQSDIDTDNLKLNLEPTIINFVKSNPNMKVLRDNKTTVNYFYKDRNGNYLLTISVTPDKYIK